MSCGSIYTPHGMAPKADTILDRIAEFAKMPACLKFCVRATLRHWRFGCPSDTDALVIFSLPKWTSKGNVPVGPLNRLKTK